MSTGTNVTAAVRRKLQLWGAILEAYLSTHAFELLFLAVYAVALSLQFVWGAHDEFHHVRIYHERPGQGAYKWYIAIARGAGYSLNFNCAIILILASRLFLTFIRETPLHRVLPLDKSFPTAHIVVGYSILIGVALHVPFHFAWVITFDKWDPFTLWSFSMTIATGVPLMAIFIFMLVTALPWMRRTNFRIFYVVHLIGSSIFFPLLILHGMYRKRPETYRWVIPAIIIYVADRIARFLKISTATISLTGESSTIKNGNVLVLRLPKPFGYRPGQYAEIAVPSLSAEWHPFTIASSPHEHTMCFYIKANGNWTKALYKEFESRIARTKVDLLQVRVRGPFGAPAQHISSYKRIVLISGGIGATPFTAIAKYLHHLSSRHDTQNTRLDHLYTQCSAKESLLQHRVNKTVGRLYDLSFDDKPLVEVLKQQRAMYIAETLSIASSNGHLQSKLSGNESDSSDAITITVRDPSETAASTNDRDDRVTPRHFPDLHGLRARALSVLRTTRVVLLLLLIQLVRISFVAIVKIWELGKFGFATTSLDPRGYWALCADTALGGVVTAIMTLTIVLELSYLRAKYFWRLDRCLDLVSFVPASLLVFLLSARSLRSNVVSGAFTIAHFALLLPLQFAQLSFRMFCARGFAGVDPLCSKGRGDAPEVDFVWTTRTASDDEWLRDELRTLADSSALRLHRYVTREGAVEVAQERHFSSSEGRPCWQALFSDIAGRACAGMEVGVFFCGPTAMGKAVQRAVRAIEIHSSLRGAYLASLSDAQIMEEFGAECKDEIRRLKCFGNNVRFVFREENF